MVLPFPFPSNDVVASDQEGVVDSDENNMPDRACGSYDLLSDVAGIDGPGTALQHLGVLGKHSAYEIDSAARSFISANFPGVSLYGSVRERSESACPRADVVTAGFPCQPFSALGKQDGWDDARGRGTLIGATSGYVLRERPSIVMLENVATFRTIHDGKCLSWVVDQLESQGGYDVYHRICCTSRFGLPQTRRRWFLIGILSTARVCDFEWPSDIDMVPLASLMAPPPTSASASNRPGPPPTLAARNVCTGT